MAQECGLVSDDGIPVPLKSIDVVVIITGFTVNVEAKLIYTNDSDVPLEATFIFPLDDQSAVYKFEALVEDRLIVAEIQSKDQARETYKEATDKGMTAALLEESDEMSDVFKCKLGNLPPKIDATLTFAFVMELSIEPDGAVKFTLPTVLNPRYNQSTDDGGTTSNPTDEIVYVSSSKLPYTLNFLAEIISKHKIDRIEAGKDKISTKTTEKQSVQVTLEEEEKFNFDHDITLYVYYTDGCEPKAIFEKGSEEKSGILTMDVAMLNFYPKFEDQDDMVGKNEFVFIIDRSGSMRGDRIKSAREALLLFLKSLPTGSYFNVIGFGSSYECLFNKSQEYDEKNMNKAIKSQKEIEANLGGTELLEPMKHVYSSKPVSGYTRQLFIITDGGCSGVNTILSLAKSNINSTRVFSIGIGDGASTSLVKGLARSGCGKYEFVSSKDRLHGKVMSLLRCAMQKSVTDVKLQLNLADGISGIQIPENVPPLFNKERLILYLIFKGEVNSGTCTAELSGKIGDQEMKNSIDINYEDSFTDGVSAPIHRLAAKAQIKELEGQERDSEFENLKPEIMTISTAANIVSKYTAFIAVDKNEKTVDGKMVPISIPRQWKFEYEYEDQNDQYMCYNLCAGIDEVDGCLKSADLFLAKASKSRRFHLPSSPKLPKVSNIFRRCCRLSESFCMFDAECYSSPSPGFMEPVCMYDAECYSSPSPGNYQSASYACMSPPARKHKSASFRLPSLPSRPKVPNIFRRFSLGKKKAAAPSQSLSTGALRVSLKKKKAAAPSQSLSTGALKDVLVAVSRSGSDTEAHDGEPVKKSETFSHPVKHSRSGDDMMDLIDLQHFDGYWTLTENLASILNKSLTDLKLDGQDDNVSATVHALAFLRKRYGSRKDEWMLIEEKALKWLKQKAESDLEILISKIDVTS